MIANVLPNESTLPQFGSDDDFPYFCHSDLGLDWQVCWPVVVTVIADPLVVGQVVELDCDSSQTWPGHLLKKWDSLCLAPLGWQPWLRIVIEYDMAQKTLIYNRKWSSPSPCCPKTLDKTMANDIKILKWKFIFLAEEGFSFLLSYLSWRHVWVCKASDSLKFKIGYRERVWRSIAKKWRFMSPFPEQAIEGSSLVL